MTDTRVEHPEPVLTPDRDLVADLDRLRGMVEASDVEGARAFVKELEAKWPDSDRVSRWARVLAPPVARVVPGKPGRSLAREHAWLREHAHEYPGCWLAVLGDQLIAVDPDVGALLATLRSTPGGRDALLHYQPGPTS